MNYNKLTKYNVKVSCDYANAPMGETYTLYARNSETAKANAIEIFRIAYEDLLCEYDASLTVEILNESTDEIKLPTYRYKVCYTIRSVTYTNGYVFVDAEDSDDAAQYVMSHIDDPDEDIYDNRVDTCQHMDDYDTDVEVEDVFIVDKEGNETSVY